VVARPSLEYQNLNHSVAQKVSKSWKIFLWDMEQYFGVARIGVDEQVNIMTMYLYGDAKLWWRTRIKDDLTVGHPKIETWDHLKQELKE